MRGAVLVAEVTQPSLGVGYEIGRALEMKKDIICLFRPSDTEKSELILQHNNYYVTKHAHNKNNKVYKNVNYCLH